jgi:hypothetical protein
MLNITLNLLAVPGAESLIRLKNISNTAEECLLALEARYKRLLLCRQLVIDN